MDYHARTILVVACEEKSCWRNEKKERHCVSAADSCGESMFGLSMTS